MADNPFRMLELSADATDEEIRQAYFRLAHKYHPDHTGNDPECTSRFKQVQQAYEKLTSRTHRAPPPSRSPRAAVRRYAESWSWRWAVVGGLAFAAIAGWFALHRRDAVHPAALSKNSPLNTPSATSDDNWASIQVPPNEIVASAPKLAQASAESPALADGATVVVNKDGDPPAKPPADSASNGGEMVIAALPKIDVPSTAALRHGLSQPTAMPKLDPAWGNSVPHAIAGHAAYLPEFEKLLGQVELRLAADAPAVQLAPRAPHGLEHPSVVPPAFSPTELHVHLMPKPGGVTSSQKKWASSRESPASRASTTPPKIPIPQLPSGVSERDLPAHLLGKSPVALAGFDSLVPEGGPPKLQLPAHAFAAEPSPTWPPRPLKLPAGWQSDPRPSTTDPISTDRQRVRVPSPWRATPSFNAGWPTLGSDFGPHPSPGFEQPTTSYWVNPLANRRSAIAQPAMFPAANDTTALPSPAGDLPLWRASPVEIEIALPPFNE